MSATATKITRPWWQVALPGANDVLGAPKQDTGGIFGTLTQPYASTPFDPNGQVNPGWSITRTAERQPGGDWSAPSTQVPYTAPSTTGGGTWDLPGWAYGGNQKGGGSYNAQTGNWDNGAALAAGSDVYGAKLPVGYNSANDRGAYELNGKNIETGWSRMLRWARDYAQGGMAPEQAMQQALDRLRRDNGGTLQGTGFEDTPGGATPTPQAGAVAGAAQASGNPTTGAGGSTVGPNDPLNPNNNPGMPQGASPAIPSGTPSPTAATTVNANGQSVPLGAYYASNPTNAVNQFLASKGVQIGSHDPWSEFLRTLATGIGKTLPQLAPNGPGGTPAYDTLANLPDQLNQLIYGNGGQVFSNVGGYADRALAALTPQINAGMKSTDVESLLQLIEMLKSSGQNPFQKSFNTQQLADLFGQYNQQQQAQGMAGHPLSAAWYLQNDPFGLYGAATGQPR